MKIARNVRLTKLPLLLACACLLMSSVETGAQVNRHIYNNATVRAIVVEVNPSGVVNGSCRDTIGFALNGVVPIGAPIPGDPSFILDPNSARLNDMYALLLLAFSTGRTVQVITAAAPVRTACNAVIAETIAIF